MARITIGTTYGRKYKPKWLPRSVSYRYGERPMAALRTQLKRRGIEVVRCDSPQYTKHGTTFRCFVARGVVAEGIDPAAAATIFVTYKE